MKTIFADSTYIRGHEPRFVTELGEVVDFDRSASSLTYTTNDHRTRLARAVVGKNVAGRTNGR